MAPNSTPQKCLQIQRVLLSLFIVFNIFALAVVLCPFTNIRSTLLPTFLPYLYASGLFQSAGVFVPNPKKYTVTLWARIWMDDGSIKEWHIVDFSRLNPFERFGMGRFRRWDDQVCNSTPTSLWLRDTACYIARQFDTPNSHPTGVELIRHRQDIAPPGSNEVRQAFDDSLYVCKITAGDL